MKQFFDVRCDENSPKWNQAITRKVDLYSRHDIRTELERAYTRILHCPAYTGL